MSLHELPIELQRRIVYSLKAGFKQRHACIKTLKTLRLTSRVLSTLSTELLFKTAILFPEVNAFQAAALSSDDWSDSERDSIKLPIQESDPRSSVSKINALQSDVELRKKVHEVILCTSYDRQEESGRTSSVVSDAWRCAAAGICHFSNLSSIHIRFREECFEDDDDYGNYKDEDEEFRSDVLKTTFCALNNQQFSVLLRSITITNLQNVNNTDIVDSIDFKSALSNISELHLLITVEDDTAAPEHSIRCKALHEFFRDGLIDAWLSPTMQNLTHLTLYTMTYWGWAPAFDPCALHFPHLKYLAIGNYTIAHDWQIDWLTSFGSTLETLIMDDCPIVFFIHPSDALDEQPSVSHEDHIRLSAWCRYSDTQNDTNSYWVYNSRWHDFFPRLEAGLPSLTKFVYTHGYDFDGRDVLLPKLHHLRYIAFNGGMGPTQWDELPKESLDMEGKRHEYTEFEGFRDPTGEIAVKTPAEVEPPYKINPQDGNGGDVGTDGNAAQRRPALGFLDNAEGQKGCQEEDETAFMNLLDTVGRRARASGLY